MKKDWTIIEANNLLNSLKGIFGLKGIKFNYAVARNIDLLNTALSTVHKTLKEANELEDPKEKEKAIAEVNLLGSEKCDYTSHAIKFEDIPEDIPTEFMTAIFPILEGEPK